MNPGERNQEPYAQPGPIMSSASNGTTQTPEPNNSNKFFGGRSRYTGPRRQLTAEENYMAAQTVASDPKLPKFFRESAAANNPVTYVNDGERKDNHKIILFGAIAVVAVIVVVAIVSIFSNVVPTTTKQDLSDNFNILANMVIFNVKTEKLDTEYDLDEGIAIVPLSRDYLGNEQYFKELKEQVEKTIQVAKGAPVDNETKDKIIDYAETMYAWVLMSEFKVFKKEIVSDLFSADYNKAKSTIENHYRMLTDSKNEKLKFAGSRYVDASVYYLDLAQLISKDGKRIDTMSSNDEQKYQKDIDRYYGNEMTLRNEGDEAVGDQFTKNIRKTWEYAEMLTVEEKK